jgi:branched-chain amino acid aminotransferase
VKVAELETFGEVIAAGTAAGLVPVRCIYVKSTGQKFEFDANGPRYQELWDALRGIQKGTVEDKFGWCCKLSAADAALNSP